MSNYFYVLKSNPRSLKDKLLGFARNNIRTIHLDSSCLKISQGQNTIELYITEVQTIQIKNKNRYYDLRDHIFGHPITYLIINHQKQTLRIESKYFDPNEFTEFIKILQSLWIESKYTFEDKLDVIYEKCKQRIRKDEHLKSEFKKKLNEVYNSVYQVYQVDKNQPNYKQVLNHPDTVFYFLNRYNYYYYYRRNFYKPNTPTHMIDTVDNMIKTIQVNLNITTTRMESYRKIQQDVKRRKIEYRKKKKLAQITQDLEILQEQNMDQTFKKQELDYDTEVVKQIDILTDNIQMITTEEKSEMLHAHITSFVELHEHEKETLEALNQQLKI